MNLYKNLDTWFNKLSYLSEMPDVHNLYSKENVEGRTRHKNLQRYFSQMLEHDPSILLVGEAPGYQGSYRTGVPFCSESILLGEKNKFGIFGGQENGYFRVYEGDKIWKEPSATIVQKTLNEIALPMIIWSTFPLHPYQPGIELSNRAPTKTEILVGRDILKELIDILQPQEVIAVGNVAENCLSSFGIPANKVRHPSHGGATEFRIQLLSLMNNIR